jgi:hypothetical protein
MFIRKQLSRAFIYLSMIQEPNKSVEVWFVKKKQHDRKILLHRNYHMPEKGLCINILVLLVYITPKPPVATMKQKQV